MEVKGEKTAEISFIYTVEWPSEKYVEGLEGQ